MRWFKRKPKMNNADIESAKTFKCPVCGCTDFVFQGKKSFNYINEWRHNVRETGRNEYQKKYACARCGTQVDELR